MDRLFFREIKNNLGVKPSSDEPEYIGPFTGKFREFMTETPVTPEDYSVEEIYIMDDFFAARWTPSFRFSYANGSL